MSKHKGLGNKLIENYPYIKLESVDICHMKFK